ncbi:MAG: hypothetical protein U0228_01360 [Myxococcaceae bacterium]
MRSGLPALLLLCACSLTPIPDLTSEYVEPCETTLRDCQLPMTLRFSNEQAAELRGDFRDGGWVMGEPMTRPDGGVWTATIQAPWGSSVQYKFFVNGTTWLLDPANPKTTPDGRGNTNSLLENVTCTKWTCR